MRWWFVPFQKTPPHHEHFIYCDRSNNLLCKTISKPKKGCLKTCKSKIAVHSNETLTHLMLWIAKVKWTVLIGNEGRTLLRTHSLNILWRFWIAIMIFTFPLAAWYWSESGHKAFFSSGVQIQQLKRQIITSNSWRAWCHCMPCQLLNRFEMYCSQ